MAEDTEGLKEIKSETDQENDMIASQILQAKNIDKKVIKKPKSSKRSREKNNSSKNKTKEVKKNSRPKKAKQEVFCEEMNNPLNIYNKKKYQESLKQDYKKSQIDKESHQNHSNNELESPGLMKQKESTTSQKNSELLNDFLLSPDEPDAQNNSAESQDKQKDSEENVQFDEQEEVDIDQENEENIHILIDKEKLEQDVLNFSSEKKKPCYNGNRRSSKERKQVDCQKVKNYLYANSDSVNYTHPKKVKAKNVKTIQNIQGIVKENKMLKKKSLQLYKTCQEFLYILSKMEDEKKELQEKVAKVTKTTKKKVKKVKREKKASDFDENLVTEKSNIPAEIGQRGATKKVQEAMSSDIVEVDRLQEIQNEEEREFERERRHLYEPKNDTQYQKKIKHAEDDLAKTVLKAKTRLNSNMNYNSSVYQKNMSKTNERANTKNTVTISQNSEKLIKPVKFSSEFFQKASCMMLSSGYSSYQIDCDMQYNTKPGTYPNYEQRFREENLPNRLRSTINNHHR